MLLRCGNGLSGDLLAGGQHGVVDLAVDVSLYAANDFGFGPAFADAAGEVVAGGLVAAESNNADDVQGAVGVSVSAAIKSVPHGFAAGCIDGRDTAEFGERGVGTDAFRVVAEGDEQGSGGVGAHAVHLTQRWARLGGESLDLDVQCLGLGVELPTTLGQRFHRDGDRFCWGTGDSGCGQVGTCSDEMEFMQTGELFTQVGRRGDDEVFEGR